jgi:hypothetical protein
LAWQIDKQAVGQKALKVWMRKVFSPQSSPGITSGSMTVSNHEVVMLLCYYDDVCNQEVDYDCTLHQAFSR